MQPILSLFPKPWIRGASGLSRGAGTAVVAPQIRFGATEPEQGARVNPPESDPTRMRILEAQALAKRQALPPLVQLLYPIEGRKVTPGMMARIRAEAASDPLFQEFPMLKAGVESACNQQKPGPFLEEEMQFLGHFNILRRMLFHKDESRQKEALDVLFNIPNDRLRMDWLDALIADKQCRLSRAIPVKAATIADPKLREETIVRLLKHPNLWVQQGALSAVTSLEDKKLADSLICQAYDDENLQTEAVRVLKDITDPALRETMILKALQDDHSDAGHLLPYLQNAKQRTKWFMKHRKEPHWGTEKALVQTAALLENPKTREKAIASLALDIGEKGEEEAMRNLLLITDKQLRYGTLMKLVKSNFDARRYPTSALNSGKEYPSYQVGKIFHEAAQDLSLDQQKALIERVLKDYRSANPYHLLDAALELLGEMSDDAFKVKMIETHVSSPSFEQCPWKIVGLLKAITDPTQGAIIMNKLSEPGIQVGASTIFENMEKFPAGAERDEYILRKCREENGSLERAYFHAGIKHLSNDDTKISIIKEVCDDKKELVHKRSAVEAAASIADATKRDDLAEFLVDHCEHKEIAQGLVCLLPLVSKPEVRNKILAKAKAVPEALETLLINYVPQMADRAEQQELLKYIIDHGEPFTRKYAVPYIITLTEGQERETLLRNASRDPGISAIYGVIEELEKIPDTPFRNEVIDELSRNPEGWIRRYIAQKAALQTDTKLRDTMIDRLIHDSDREVREHALDALPLVSEPGLQGRLIRECCRSNEWLMELMGLRLFNSLLAPNMQGFLERVPYFTLVDKALQKLPQSAAMTLKDAMAAMEVLVLTGQDAGNLITRLGPQYDQLLAFAKTEVNKHLPPNQQPFSETEIGDAFETKKATIQMALCLSGPGPLKLKLAQGLERFNRYLETLQIIHQDGPVLQGLAAVSQKSQSNPYFITQVMELAAGFCLLREDGSLRDELDRIAQLKTLDNRVLRQMGESYMKAFSKACNLQCQIDPDSLKLWNLEYTHALADAYRVFDADAKTRLKEIIEATLGNRFVAYLTDPESEVGKANAENKKLFTEAKLDYDLWLNYKTERPFSLEVSEERDNRQRFAMHLQELSELMVKLIGSHKNGTAGMVDGETGARLFKLIQSQGFGFKDGLLTSNRPELMTGHRLGELTKAVDEFLESQKVWSTAKEQSNMELQTLRTHLTPLVDRFQAIRFNPTSAASTQRYRIKAWDRNPGYDLFQGNYSQCCIAVNQPNRSGIVDYLTNTGVQIVEIKDESNGKTIANTFLFWLKDAKTQEMALVADNVEIAKEHIGAASVRIREELAAYLKEYAAAVAGKPVPVLLGHNYNDIETRDLKSVEKTVTVLSKSPDNKLYLDCLNAGKWSDISKPYKANFYAFSLAA